MNRSYLLAIAIFLVVLTFGVYSLNNNKDNFNKKDHLSTIDKSTTLKDLIALEKAQKCIFKDGQLFIANGKIRGDFLGKTHMLVVDEANYIWSDGETTGVKTSSNIDATPNPEVATPEAGVSGTTKIDYNEKDDYECENWIVDNQMFELPKGVVFQDLSKQTKSINPKSDENSAQCGYCETLEGESRTQCLKALSCN